MQKEEGKALRLLPTDSSRKPRTQKKTGAWIRICYKPPGNTFILGWALTPIGHGMGCKTVISSLGPAKVQLTTNSEKPLNKLVFLKMKQKSQGRKK